MNENISFFSQTIGGGDGGKRGWGLTGPNSNGGGGGGAVRCF